MSEYGDLINESFGLDARQQARADAATTIDENPDEAARAVKLGRMFGVEPTLIHGDLDAFENERKGGIASALVESDPRLVTYLNSNPMAARVSNDDYDKLSKVGAAIDKVGRVTFSPDMARLAYDTWDFIKEGAHTAVLSPRKIFGGGEIEDKDLQQRMEEAYLKSGKSPSLAKAEALYFMRNMQRQEGMWDALFAIPTIAAAPVFGAFRTFISRPIEEAGGFPKELTEQFAVAGAAAVGLRGMHKGFIEEGKLKEREAENKKKIEEVNQALIIAGPYLRDGKEPPAGLHPLIDEYKAEQAKIDASNLSDALSEATASATRGRSPELFEEFARQQVGDREIGLPVDIIQKLYGDKAPTPDDGLLGWVPEIKEKITTAVTTGGDVRIPLADWLAKVDPSLARELKDFIRVREEGLTLEEAKALPKREPASDESRALVLPSEPAVAAVDAVRKSAGLEPLFDRERASALKLNRTKVRSGPYASFTEDQTVKSFQQFKITDEIGREVGDLHIAELAEGKELYIDWIGGADNVLNQKGGIENVFGPRQVRELLRQLAIEYPEAETISGYRVSGARDKAGAIGMARIAIKTLTEEGVVDLMQLLREGEWIKTSKETESFFPKEWTDAEAGVVRAVDEVLEKILPQAKFYEKYAVTDILVGGHSVSGLYTMYSERIPIIQYALSSLDPLGTARHEAIHHLRRMGFFTRAEWSVLQNIAIKEGWVYKERHGPGSSIYDRHKGRAGVSLLLEEAIADEFKYWKRKPGDYPAEVNTIFEKLRKFLADLKQKFEELRSKNPAVEAIFEKIESGEIGSRKPTGPLDPAEFKGFDRRDGGFIGELADREKQGELAVTRQEDLEIAKANAFGMTLKQYQIYQKLIERKNQEDIEYAFQKAAVVERRKQTPEWRDNEAKVRSEVDAEIRGAAEISALTFVEKTKIDPKYVTPEEREALPNSLFAKGGENPDIVASLFGFQTGGVMLERLAMLKQAMGESSLRDYVKSAVDYETARRMEKEFGELDKNIRSAALDHALGETQMDLLHEETLAMGMRAGAEMTYTKADVKEWIDQRVGETPIKSLKVDAFLRDSGKADKLVELALLEQEFSEGFRQAQRRQFSAMMAKEAARIEKEVEQFTNQARSLSRREVPGLPAEFTNFIHAILMQIGMPVRRSIQDLAGEIGAGAYPTLKDFVESKRKGFIEGDEGEHGHVLPVPEFLYDPNWRKPFKELTGDEFQAVRDAVKALAKAGRDESKVERAGEKYDLHESIDQMVGEIETLPVKEDELRVDVPKGIFKRLGRTYLAASLTIESLMNRFDRNNPRGIFNQTIVRPLVEAANQHSAWERDVGQRFNDLSKIADINKKVENWLFIDPRTGEPLSLSRRNMLAILQNMGNKENWEGLLKGYKIPPERWQEVADWVFDNTTKEDWDRAQALGGIFKEIKGHVDNMYRHESGVAPQNVPVWTIETPFGPYEGWYHPIIYDRNMPQSSDKLTQAKVIEYPTFTQTTPGSGYTKSRTGYVGPYLLNFDQIPFRMQAMLHDAAYRPALLQVSKIFGDSKFQGAILKHYGEEYKDLLMPFLKDMANAGEHMDKTQAAGAAVLEFFRQNIMSHLVGLNPSTIAKHDVTALVQSITEVGAQNYLKWQASLWSKNEATGESNWSFAIERSLELQRRHRNYLETVKGGEARVFGDMAGGDLKGILSGFEDRPVIEGLKLAIEQIKGRYMSLREVVMLGESWPLAKLDLLSAVPVWLAQYEKSKLSGTNEGQAVFEADRAVRRAHGSTAYTNRPALMRGNALVRTFASFYGFFNHMLQREYEMAWAIRGAMRGEGYYVGARAEKTVEGLPAPNILEFTQGKTGEWSYKNDPAYRHGLALIGILAGMFVSYVIWPAFWEEIVNPMHETEKDSYPWYLAKATMKGASGSWLFVRDFVHAAIEGGDVSAGMMGQGFRNILNSVKDLTKHDLANTLEKKQKLIRNANSTFSTLSGLSSNSPVRMGVFGYNYYQGLDKPRTAREFWRGVTTGSSKQKKGH